MVEATLAGLHAQLLLPGDVNAHPLLDRMVDAIEGDPLLRPTHWATAAGLRDPYDRPALIEAVQAKRPEIVPHLLRTRGPVRYAARWYDHVSVLGSLHLVTRGTLTPADADAFFASISAVAGVLPIEWGHVDTTFTDQAPDLAMKSSGSSDHLEYYAQLGPGCLFPRTFFGPRLLDLIGEDAATTLSRAGLPATRLPNGVLQLDLLDQPWTSDPASLRQAQQRAHPLVSATGVFRRPVGQGRDEPGPRWAPIPHTDH
jgi:hypothetical protein